MTISTDRDKVRLLIGDTDVSDPLLYDDEIAWHLETNKMVTTLGGTTYNYPAAGADAAGAIAAKFARDYNFREDTQGFERTQRVAHYLSVERRLRNRSGGASILVTSGGTETTT